MDIFNTREVALLVWICIGLIWTLSKKQIRKSLTKLLSAVFARKLTAIYCWASLYTILVVYILYRLNLWDNSQLKNTIVWLLTAGFISLFDATNKKANFFKDALKDVFGITALLEFVVNLYTFNVIIELLLIPVFLLISGMLVLSERDAKYVSVRKFLNSLLIVFGFFLIVYSLYQIIVHFRTFANTGTLSDFLIPSTLSLLFIPFIYLLSIWMSYEMDFIRVNAAVKNKQLAKYAKRKASIHFRFDRDSLDRWSNLLFRIPINSKTDIDQSIKMIKQLKEIEKKPPYIPFEEGWSPYKAKDFLTNLGLSTGHYNPVGDGEWFASSIHLDLNDSDFLSNNLSYYIEGNESIATKLSISLGVNDPTAASSAHQKLVEAAMQLYRASMRRDVPNEVTQAIISSKSLNLIDGNRKITVAKREWSGHLQKGYAMNFVIQLALKAKQGD